MSSSQVYIMGHTDHERRRLALQAQALNPFTNEFFYRAGIAPGMRVLDLGCGVGEVSLIASRIVGPSGSVTGVDIDEAALAIARQRAAEEGFDHAQFIQANVTEFNDGAPYDAVVGRLILIHAPDAAEMVRHAASLVRTGGIVAFQDYDLSRMMPTWPRKPLQEKTFRYFIDLFTRFTPAADVGTRLYQLLQGAGLESVQCRAEIPVDGGPDSIFHEWFAETVRTVVPKLEAAGIATAAEIEIETLAERLRTEVEALGGCVTGPILWSAAARKL
jgi:2-polyprenyl-3-methyl-5-hydroxy-6-metoxy-1,4-benzoquinol methylase